MIVQEPLPLSTSLKNTIHVLNSDRSVQPDTLSFTRTPTQTWRSQDPRTFDSPRSMHLQLDRPPLQSSGTQPQQNVNCLSKGSGTGFYSNYASIYNGDIVYYTDLMSDEPFGGPVFQNPATIHPTLLIDPMGSHKPYYQRVPLFQRQTGLYDYSFDRDQCEFREDLISLQQSKINRSNFSYHLFANPSTYYPMFSSHYKPFSRR